MILYTYIILVDNALYMFRNQKLFYQKKIE